MGHTGQFCTFYLDGHLFGVPVQQVQEVIRYQEATRVPLVPPVIRGLINLRGQIVTVIDLRRRLGMADRPESQLPMNVVVRTNDGAVSFLVDEIGEVLEADDENSEPPPETVHGQTRELLRSVYKLRDRLMLVLDTERAVRGDTNSVGEGCEVGFETARLGRDRRTRYGSNRNKDRQSEEGHFEGPP